MAHQIIEIDLQKLAAQLVASSEEMATFTMFLSEAIGELPANTMGVKAQMLGEKVDPPSVGLVATYFNAGFAKAKELQEDGHEPV